MTETVKCPVCVKKGKTGENVYRRDDGTCKCRTCGSVFEVKKE
jgi:uncharacterized Zn finger protein